MYAFITTCAKVTPKVVNQGTSTPTLGVLHIVFDSTRGTTDVYLQLDEANHLLKVLGPIMTEINAQAAERAARNGTDSAS